MSLNDCTGPAPCAPTEFYGNVNIITSNDSDAYGPGNLYIDNNLNVANNLAVCGDIVVQGTLTASTGGFLNSARIYDEKSTGSNGGAVGVGNSGVWLDRDLNTLDGNLGGSLSLGVTNAFSLDAGLYKIQAIIPGANGIGGFSSRLRNITTNETISQGTNGYATSSNISQSFINTVIDISTTNEYVIEQIAANDGTDTTYYGIANNISGVTEIYTDVIITSYNS